MMRKNFKRLTAQWIIVLCLILVGAAANAATVSSVLDYITGAVVDQDDACIWINPTDTAQSTIIASDKTAHKIFVYDLAGNLLQTLSANKPGNIDIRYGFMLDGSNVDLVGFNARNSYKVLCYKVDPDTRLLTRVDDENISTGSNYGFSMYKSPTTGKYYAFTVDQNGNIKQFELSDNGAGAEPSDPTTGVRIASAGDASGLVADIEGLTIYYCADGEGYIIASSQGNNTFRIYDRKAPHTYRGFFEVTGVGQTDGIDVTNMPLDSTFSEGMFICHNGNSSPYEQEGVKWGDIAGALGLVIDTEYWDPRFGGSECVKPLGLRLTLRYKLLTKYGY